MLPTLAYKYKMLYIELIQFIYPIFFSFFPNSHCTHLFPMCKDTVKKGERGKRDKI